MFPDRFLNVDLIIDNNTLRIFFVEEFPDPHASERPIVLQDAGFSRSASSRAVSIP